MKTQLPTWVQYGQALGPSFVAVVAACIAGVITYRQWRTARDNLRINLFDKRYQVYRAFLAASKAAVAKDSDRVRITIEFAELLWQSDFLFDEKVSGFLKKANGDIATLIALQDDLEEQKLQSPSSGFNQGLENIRGLRREVMRQREEAFDVFKPFMSFEMIKHG